MQKTLNDSLKNLPKAELHCHLELAYPLHTFRKLCAMKSVAVPADDDALRKMFFITEPMNDLGSVLHKFTDSQKLVASREALRLLTAEIIHWYKNQGVVKLELRYAPTFIQAGNLDLNFDQIHEAILAGIEDCKSLKIQVGLIIIIQRTLSIAVAEKVVDFAIANRNTILAMDLADNEIDFPCQLFARPFERVRAAGIPITIHAGEIRDSKSIQSVRDAVEILGASRIGHGVQIMHDESMIEFIKARKIPLELCPTSNYLTQSVSELRLHPIRKLLHQGVIVTLNSDDPGIFNTSLLHEYELAHNVIGCTTDELKQIAENSLRVSFLK